MKNLNSIFLSLGSNIGDKENNLIHAVRFISNFSADDINKTLNYEEIVNLVIKFVNTESYDLIETLAKQISEQIVFKYAKNESMLQEIKVTVHKPDTILKDRTEGISVSYSEEFK